MLYKCFLLLTGSCNHVSVSQRKAFWLDINPYAVCVQNSGLIPQYRLKLPIFSPRHISGSFISSPNTIIVSPWTQTIGTLFVGLLSQNKDKLWKQLIKCQRSEHSLRSPGGWNDVCATHLSDTLKVIYHPLYSMNNFVTNKSKLPQDGAQVFPYMGWLAIMWPFERVTR